MKRFRNIQVKLLAMLAFLALSITSCVDAPEPAISVDKTTLTTEAFGDNFLYKITSNAEWTIKSDSDWCVPSQTEGLGTETINIKVGVNNSTKSREATLTLKCGANSTTIKVLQGAQSTVLKASPESTTISANDQTLNVVVVSNDNWTVESSHDWATLTRGVEKGANNGVVSIACDENTTGSSRTATLTAYITKDNEQSIVSTTVITQNEKSAPRVELSQKSVKFSNEAGSLLVPFVSNTTNITLTSDFDWCVPTVDGSNVKISVGANTTSTSSRVAIVTVSALVDGKSTSTQILVTQEGAPSSELYILTNNINISQAGGNATLQYVNPNGAEVAIKSLTSWIVMDDSGNTFTVPENINPESRTGTIEIASENSTGKSLYYVTVTQAGTGTPMAYVSPSSVSLAPERGKGVVTVFVDAPAVTWERAISSSSWLRVDSNIVDGAVSYTYDQSMSDAIREATISVIYKVGNTPYSVTVPVTQNGLGAPGISTLDKVFIECDETSRTLDLWLENGDKDGVTYNWYVECNSSGVSNDNNDEYITTNWITNANIKNNKLYLTFATNRNNSERYGTVTVIATRGDSKTIKRIEFIQAGHLSAGISAGSQEIFHDYNAVMGCEFEYQSLNNSTVSPVSYPEWINEVNVNSNNDGFTYNIEEYKGGVTGTFREGYIVLKVENGSKNHILYSILVRQYAPESAEANYDSSVYVEYQEGEYNFILDLQNESSIESATSNVDWLTIGELPTTKGGTVEIPYSVKQFTGATGTSREAKVTVTVKNPNANTSTYTITVTQGEPVAASADVPGTVYVPYGMLGSVGNVVKSSHNFSLELTSGSNIADVKVVNPEVASWLDIKSFSNPNTSAASSKAYVYFNTVTNTGDKGERTATIAVTIQSDNANKEIYYVDIVQGTPEVPIISIATGETYSYEAAEKYSVAFNTPSTVTAVYAELVDENSDWVIGIDSKNNILSEGALNFGLQLNDTGLPRTAVVMLTAEGDNYRDAVTYFTITQEQLGAASSSYPSTMYVPNRGTNEAGVPEFIEVDLSTYLYNNGIIEDVEVSAGNGNDGNWLKAKKVSDYKFEYAVELFEGPEETRTGTITLTLVNSNSQKEKHVITVIQGAVVDAAADVPASYTFGYEGAINFNLSKEINLKNDSNIKNIKVADIDKKATDEEPWLTVEETTAGEYKLRVAKHDGLNGARTGRLLVIVTNKSYNDEFYYIDIYQGVPDEPTIETPEHALAYDYKAHSDLIFNVNPNGATVVTASSDSNWLTVEETVTNGVVNYSMTEYNNSSEDFREATITLVASNDNYRDDIAFVSVRQYAQGAAGIEGESLVERSIGSQEASYNFWVNLLNDATIKEVHTDAKWLEVSSTANADATGTVKLKLDAEAYDGTMGENRQAVVYIAVKNNNNNLASYSFVVTQGAPSNDLATIPGSILVPTTSTSSIDSDAAKYNFNTTLATGAVITKIEVLDPTETDWITLGNKTETVVESELDQAGIDDLSYFVKQYNGSKGDSRTGTIAMTVKGKDGNMVIYSIVVTQGAAVEQLITVGAESTFDFDKTTGTIKFKASGENTTVTAKKQSDSSKWLDNIVVHSNTHITFDLEPNTTGENRSVMVELTAKGSYFRPATAYVKVTQTAEGEAMMDAPSKVYLEYLYCNPKISLNLKNGATITKVASSQSWLTVVDQPEGSGEVVLQVNATTFTGATGDSREANLYITVANGNDETSTYTINVLQGAPVAAEADVPATLTVPYGRINQTFDTPVWDNYTFKVKLNAGSSITHVGVVDANNVDWIKYVKNTEVDTSSKSANSIVTYSVEANDGTQGARTATIEVCVKSANANSEVYYVNVTQGEPTAPVITMEQAFTYDYTAAEKTIAYTTTDARKVTATVEADWITDVDYATTGEINFALTENTTGAPRSATMTVTASGDSYRDAITYVTITQNELGAASLDYNNVIYAPYSGTNGDVWLDLEKHLENGATITDAKLLESNSDNSETWLEIDYDINHNTGIYYNVAAFDALSGSSRKAQVMLTLKNANDKEEFFTITVIQGASTEIPDEVSASTVESMSIPYSAGSYVVPVVPTEGAITAVDVVSDVDWLTIANDDKTATVTTTEPYTGASPRSAVVSVTVTNGTATATYLVTVYQGVSEAASITVPSEVISYNYNWQGAQSIKITSVGTVSVSTDAEWIEKLSYNSNYGSIYYTIGNFKGTSSANGYREGMITVKSENNGKVAYAYITIRQYEQEKAAVNAVSEVAIGKDGDFLRLDVNMLNDSEVQYVAVSDDWMQFYENATEYKGKTGRFVLRVNVNENKITEPRSGRIVISAKNSSNELCLFTINVSQDGATPIPNATISTVPDVLLGSEETSDAKNVAVMVSNGVNKVTASHDTDWISLVDVATKAVTTTKVYTASNGEAAVAFTLAENTTGKDREAYITLKAEGNEVTPAVTYLKVKQSANLVYNPMIGNNPEIYVPTAGKDNSYTFSTQGIKGNIKVILRSNPDDLVVNNNEFPMTLTPSSEGKITFTVKSDANTTSQKRQAVLQFSGENANGVEIVSSSTFIQMPAESVAPAKLELPLQFFTAAAANETAKISFPISGVEGKVIAEEYNDYANFINSTFTNSAQGENSVTFTYKKGENTSTVARSATIRFRANNSAGEETLTYVTITQAGAEAVVPAGAPELFVAPVVSLASTAPAPDPAVSSSTALATLSVGANNISGNVSFKIESGSDMFTSASINAVTNGYAEFSYVPRDNTSTEERVAIVSFTGENSDGDKTVVYTTFIQKGAAETVVTPPSCTYPSVIFVSAESTGIVTIDATNFLGKETKIFGVADESQGNSDTNWFDAWDVDSDDTSFGYKVYPNETTDVRKGSFSLKLKNSVGDILTHTIYVIQDAGTTKGVAINGFTGNNNAW